MAVMRGIREYVLRRDSEGPVAFCEPGVLKARRLALFLYKAVWRYLLFHILAALCFSFFLERGGGTNGDGCSTETNPSALIKVVVKIVECVCRIRGEANYIYCLINVCIYICMYV